MICREIYHSPSSLDDYPAVIFDLFTSWPVDMPVEVFFDEATEETRSSPEVFTPNELLTVDYAPGATDKPTSSSTSTSIQPPRARPRASSDHSSSSSSSSSSSGSSSSNSGKPTAAEVIARALDSNHDSHSNLGRAKKRRQSISGAGGTTSKGGEIPPITFGLTSVSEIKVPFGNKERVRFQAPVTLAPLVRHKQVR